MAADNSSTSESNVFIPYTTGVTTTGFINSDGNMTGSADVLTPVFGTSSQFFLTDAQLQYHDNNSFAGSAGLGARWLTDDAGILGAYVFADYNQSPGHGFMFINPGIESLGTRFDFSANLYLPVGSRKFYDGVVWADQAGDTSHEVAHDHQIDDMHDQVFYSVGAGADAEIGYRIPGNFKYSPEIFAGGYYFKPQDSDQITGATFRVELPLNKYFQLIASEAYQTDGTNTIKAGVSFNFGGRDSGFNANQKTLADRMADPIRRNLSSVSGSTVGTNQPIAKDLKADGVMQTEITNISFFKPGQGSDTGVSGDGTAENPYISMNGNNTQQGLNEGNTKFFLAPGQYDAPAAGINFNSDGGIYGRDSTYLKAATGSDTPIVTLNGQGISLSGSDNTIDSVNFIAGANQVGNMINVTAVQANLSNINLDGVVYNKLNGIEIDGNAQSASSVKLSNITATNMNLGIAVNNQNHQDLSVDLENAKLTGNRIGVSLLNAYNNLMFTGNDLTVTGNGRDAFMISSGTTGPNAPSNQGKITVDVNNSNLSANGKEGIESNNYSDVDIKIQNSDLTNNKQAIYMSELSSGKSANIDISNSTLSAKSGGSAAVQVALAAGIQGSTANATITNSSITTSDGSTMPLLYVQNGGTISVVNPTAFNGLVLVDQATNGGGSINFTTNSNGTPSTLAITTQGATTVNCDSTGCTAK
jgi:hypothetical protein